VFETHASDPVLEGLVRPLWHLLRSISVRARLMQGARLSTRLLYVVAALVMMLFYLLVDGWRS
jgi:hypothetical protein